MSRSVTMTESVDLLQVLLDLMPENIYFKDADGRFTRVSRSLAQYYGVKDPAEVVGKTDFDFYPREDAEQYRRDEMEIMRSGRPMIEKEERCLAPGGRTMWFLTTKIPIRDDRGTVVGIAGVSHDITARKRTEDALRDSEERFRRIYQSNMLGIHFWDASGEVTEANDAYLRMIGYSADDLAAGRVRWRDLTPPEYAPVDDRALELLRTDGVCPPFEKEYIRRDGRRIPVLLGAALLPHSQHEGVAYALDLTDLKQAERELLRQRQEQEIILDSVPAMIWYKDRDNRIIRANAVAAASRGVSKADLEGKSTWDLYPEHAQAYHQDDLEVINSGRPKMGIIEPLQIASGEQRWLRTDKIPYRDDSGEIVGVIVFATDITELKLAEDALRREQQLMQILMDNMPDAIYFKDRDSRFLRTNTAHARIMGLADPQEAIGRSDADFFRPMDAAAFRADEKMVIDTGRSVIGRLEYHGGSSGEMRWWSTTKVPLRGAAGDIVGIAGITRDITKVKRAEEEIRQLNEALEQRVADRTARLEAANRRLEAEVAERREAERQIHIYQERLRSLASELSLAEERERRRIAIDLHDQIGQTLALIQIRLQTMREAVVKGPLAKELDACVELIRQPIHDTRSLVFNLSPPVLYDLGLASAAAWIVDQHQGRRGLKITFEDDEQPKPLDEAVSVLVFRAIRELVTNIVKHAQAKTARVWLRTEDQTLRVGVEDDGRGFASPSPAAQGGAGGFGLFSIREQLERIGGSMDIKSSPGAGSRIILSVPLQQDRSGASA
jgi:PAS domain S-box-containing protein